MPTLRMRHVSGMVETPTSSVWSEVGASMMLMPKASVTAVPVAATNEPPSNAAVALTVTLVSMSAAMSAMMRFMISAPSYR